MGGRAYDNPPSASSCSWVTSWMVIHCSKRACLTASPWKKPREPLTEQGVVVGKEHPDGRLVLGCSSSSLLVWPSLPFPAGRRTFPTSYMCSILHGSRAKRGGLPLFIGLPRVFNSRNLMSRLMNRVSSTHPLEPFSGSEVRTSSQLPQNPLKAQS